MGTIIDYEDRHADRLRASPNNRVVTRPSEKFEGDYYMQNKPNFRKTEMNITSALAKDYENIPPTKKCQNKPNQTQFHHQICKTNPNRTQFQPKNEANKPNQTQFYPPPADSKGTAAAKIRMACEQRKKQLLRAKTCGSGQSRKRGANIHAPGDYRSG